LPKKRASKRMPPQSLMREHDKLNNCFQKKPKPP
jgi:hypothetical protein